MAIPSVANMDILSIGEQLGSSSNAGKELGAVVSIAGARSGFFSAGRPVAGFPAAGALVPVDGMLISLRRGSYRTSRQEGSVCSTEILDHSTPASAAFAGVFAGQSRDCEVFTFRADVGKRGLAGVLPTG
jgi:hypothetical protein